MNGVAVAKWREYARRHYYGDCLMLNCDLLSTVLQSGIMYNGETIPVVSMCLRLQQPMKTNTISIQSTTIAMSLNTPRQSGMPSAAKAHSTNRV